MLKEEFLKFSIAAGVCPGVKIESIEEGTYNQSRTVYVSTEKNNDIWVDIGNFDKNSLYMRRVYYKKNNVIYNIYTYGMTFFRDEVFHRSRRVHNYDIASWLDAELEAIKAIISKSIDETEKVCLAIHDILGHNGKNSLVYGARYRTMLYPLLDKEHTYTLMASVRGDYIEPWNIRLLQDNKAFPIPSYHTTVKLLAYLKTLHTRTDGEPGVDDTIIYKMFLSNGEKQLKNDTKCGII